MMTKDEKFQIGMALNKIALSLSEEDFQKVKEHLKCIEKIVAEQTEPSNSEIPNNCIESVTQTETQNSNLTFEKTERKCIDCNFLTYMFGKTWCNIKCENPHDKVCDRFKPKDEPQTDCAWR